MSVVSATEQHQDRRSGQDNLGKKTHQRVWIVITNDPADGTAAALTAAGVPQPGSSYAGVPFSGSSADPVDGDDLTFKVTVNYATGSGGAVDDDDPLARPADVNWEGSETTEPFFRDFNDKPVANSAGEPFQDLIDRERSVGTVIVERNEAAFDDASMEDFRDTVNSGVVTIAGSGYAAGTLKMGAITASLRIENGVTYYRVRYPIKKNRDGWKPKYEDRGFNELDAGKLKKILDADSEHVTMPWPLDGAGAAQANATDVPAEIEFQPYEEKSWVSLSLPA